MMSPIKETMKSIILHVECKFAFIFVSIANLRCGIWFYHLYLSVDFYMEYMYFFSILLITSQQTPK